MGSLSLGLQECLRSLYGQGQGPPTFSFTRPPLNHHVLQVGGKALLEWQQKFAFAASGGESAREEECCLHTATRMKDNPTRVEGNSCAPTLTLPRTTV